MVKIAKISIIAIMIAALLILWIAAAPYIRMDSRGFVTAVETQDSGFTPQHSRLVTIRFPATPGSLSAGEAPDIRLFKKDNKKSVPVLLTGVTASWAEGNWIIQFQPVELNKTQGYYVVVTGKSGTGTDMISKAGELELVYQADAFRSAADWLTGKGLFSPPVSPYTAVVIFGLMIVAVAWFAVEVYDWRG